MRSASPTGYSGEGAKRDSGAKANGIPEGEQQSERSDADLMIVPEGLASSMQKKAFLAGFIRCWIALFTHGLSAHLDAMGVVLIFRGTPNVDRRPPLSANAYLIFRTVSAQFHRCSACEKNGSVH